MNDKKKDTESKVLKAVRSVVQKKVTIKSHHSLVTDLDLDSLRMVNLSLALEKKFHRPLLLNDWVSRLDYPQEMTVASLCQYILELQFEERKFRRLKRASLPA